MSNLFFQDSNYSSDAALPVISDIREVFVSQSYEKDSYGHWVFYKDEPLVDKVNSRPLTVQQGAAIQPIFTPDGVALTNAKGSALMSTLVDSTTTSITALYVAKTTSNGLYLMGMTLPNTNVTTENGFGAYASGDKVYVNLKPQIATNIGAVQGITTNQSITQTGYFLVAVSVDKVKKSVLLYSLQGDNDAFVASNYTGNYETTGKVMSVGNAYYNAVESGTKTTYAEAIMYDRALSLSEIKMLAQRTKLRLAGNGIII